MPLGALNEPAWHLGVIPQDEPDHDRHDPKPQRASHMLGTGRLALAQPTTKRFGLCGRSTLIKQALVQTKGSLVPQGTTSLLRVSSKAPRRPRGSAYTHVGATQAVMAP